MFEYASGAVPARLRASIIVQPSLSVKNQLMLPAGLEFAVDKIGPPVLIMGQFKIRSTRN
jgi:hypothetical protein